MIILSKTNYLVYRDYKKNAWLKIHRPDIYNASQLSEFEKAIIETGNEVEREARKLFPRGILIEGRDEAAIEATKKLSLGSEAPKWEPRSQVIFQPAFKKDLPDKAGGFFAAIDILEYDSENQSYNIYEVKASNETKPSVHLYDLTFQYILLKDCGLKIKSANLMHLNSEYVRQGELDLDKLFISDDLTEQVKEIEEEVRAEMNRALKYVSQDKEPAGNCDCLYKGRSKHCTTFGHSNKEVPEYSIHDIARIGVSKAKLAELINSEIFHIKDIPEKIKLSSIQQNQVDAHILDRVLIDKMKISEELSKLAFPLYFLDYETFPCAIPRFDGFSPYQQIPFQFSLHVYRGPSSTRKDPISIEHFEYLHTENSDPSSAFAENLKKHIGREGTIIVWNKKFECKINEQLGDRLPEYRAFVEDMNSRVYDLMDIFSKQYYVHKDFRGSTSIKYVLPVLAPELSYKDLAIQEGGTASQAWAKIIDSRVSAKALASAGGPSSGSSSGGRTSLSSLASRDKLAHDLKDYCKLDTYAMYAIWQALVEFNRISRK